MDNRTDGGRTHNAANEVVGFTYDAVGNLLDDGSTSYTYDALGRLTQQGGTSYTYNGDGVLVGRGSTTYTQDLVAPLEQVLNDGTTNLVYGHTRMTSSDGAWYQHDGLGSVRAVLDGAGAVQSTTSYDPWGVPTAGSTDPFGFTGELHDGDLVHLRARWYHPGIGTFTARDPFAGFDNLPYSLHPYQYAYSNPVLLTDPSGLCPAPPPNSGDVICVALFIATATIGPEIPFTVSFPPYGVLRHEHMLPLALGDGRGFSANSKSMDTLPKQGGSRGYMYIYLDPCGQITLTDSFFNRSYILGGVFDLGFGPIREYEQLDATQSGNDITVVWDMPNGASAWARRNAHRFNTTADVIEQIPDIEAGNVQDVLRLNASIQRTMEWLIGLDDIDGTLTISFDPATSRYAVTSMERDPYPSLEVYHYKDGMLHEILLQRQQTPAGPYEGLRPSAPRDTIP